MRLDAERNTSVGADYLGSYARLIFRLGRRIWSEHLLFLSFGPRVSSARL
jgi:hypothetical protein